MCLFMISLTILCFITPFVVTDRPDFREDYRYEESFMAYYKSHPEAVTWHEALIRCQAEGADLMVPHSLDEADSAMRIIASDLSPNQPGVYLGIHDLYSERIFVTINGSAVHNTFLELLWLYEEPRANAGRCVAMKRNGRLFVNPCDTPLPFVCKIKDSDISYYEDCDTYNYGWVPGPNGHCYLAHTEPQTWFQAYSTCVSEGGYLAVIMNRTEADFIRDLFRNMTDQPQPNSDFAFLGFSDLFQKYHFVTVQGVPVDNTNFTDWDRKCPEKDTYDPEYRCGGIMRSGLLSFSDCRLPAVFFCEKLP